MSQLCSQIVFSRSYSGIKNAFATISRAFRTTSVNGVDQRWRESKGLPKNPNAYGVLTDTPDYTFLDGRPTPYGVRQRKRMAVQREIAEKIITYTQEIDFAVKRHEQLQIAEKQEKERIIASKWRPKGTALMNRKKNDA